MTTTLIAPARAAPPLAPPRLRRMRYEPEPGHEDETRDARDAHAGAAREPAAPAPEVPDGDRGRARAAVSEVLRLAMEVLDGRRSATHLARHLDAAPLRYWRVATQQRATAHPVRGPARIERILLCAPRAGAIELAAVCRIDTRVRALAARFERSGPAEPWRCTALRLG